MCECGTMAPVYYYWLASAGCQWVRIPFDHGSCCKSRPHAHFEPLRWRVGGSDGPAPAVPDHGDNHELHGLGIRAVLN